MPNPRPHQQHRLGQGTAVSIYLPRAELPARIGTPPVLEEEQVPTGDASSL